jgi:hypothetical protein
MKRSHIGIREIGNHPAGFDFQNRPLASRAVRRQLRQLRPRESCFEAIRPGQRVGRLFLRLQTFALASPVVDWCGPMFKPFLTPPGTVLALLADSTSWGSLVRAQYRPSDFSAQPYGFARSEGIG